MTGGRVRAVSPVLAIGVIGLASAPSSRAQQAEAPAALLTPAEAAGWLAYTPPDSALPWLRRLAASAPGVRVERLAELPVPDGPPADLAAVFLSSPEDAGEARLRVLVIGSQHGDERAGYEACLLLARDLAIGPLRPLLASMNVAVVPVANPVGMRMGTRRDAAGIDLNRDHGELLSEPDRALATLRTRWRPDVVLDLHEMAPSAYGIQVGLPTHPNVDPELVRLARYRLLPWMVHQLALGDVRFHEYVATHPDPNAERPPPPEPDSASFASWAPIDANNARNVFALAGSIALLVETSSDATVESLGPRTARLALAVRALLEVAADQSEAIRAATERARSVPAGTELALTADYAVDPAHLTLPWLVPGARDAPVPSDIENWRPRVIVTDSLPLPGGWLLGEKRRDLVELLRRQGFRAEEVLAPTGFRVRAWVNGGRSLDSRPREVEVGPGAWRVPADQPGARLLFTLVEPGSMDGWLAWTSPEVGTSDEVWRLEGP